MFDRVLILSASAGAGHLRAAEAIKLAFEQLGAARHVEHIDTLEYTNKIFRDLYSKAYIELVNKSPELLGWLYDYLDKPWRHQRRRLALDKLNTRKFIKMLEQTQPQSIVCTHFLPAEIISWLKAEQRLSSPQAIVVTDMDVHAMWLCKQVEQYFVAMEETRTHLSRLGIPAERIAVTGIPIDPVFALHKDKQEMRRKHGLHADRTTLLISAGGFGVGPIEHLIQTLSELRHEAQIVAICGRSEELKTRIEALVAKLPADGRVSFKIVGFTREMDEFMAAADIVVGKPGGLTTSEALAKGLIYVIVNPIPGQEERNADHLLEEGAAIRCNNLPALAWKIDRLLDNPAHMAAMQANVHRLAHPRAAFDVVQHLLTMPVG